MCYSTVLIILCVCKNYSLMDSKRKNIYVCHTPLNPTCGLKPKVVVPKVVLRGVDWTVPFGTARN